MSEVVCGACCSPSSSKCQTADLPASLELLEQDLDRCRPFSDRPKRLGAPPVIPRNRLQSLRRAFGSYDLVLSTSPELMASLPWLHTNLHFAYVPSVADFQKELPETIHHHRPRFLNHLSHKPRFTHAFPTSNHRTAVDHWLLGSTTIRDLCGLPQDDSNTILYPPINLQAFRPAFCRREAIYLLPCESQTPTHLPLAIAAARQMNRRLVILAHAENAPRISTTENFEVVVCPNDQAAADWYARCEAVLFPDFLEFDLSLIEAQACGAPIVALDAGAAQETLIDSEAAGMGTGVFFSDQNVESLVSALRELERRPQRCSSSLAWSSATGYSHLQFERRMRQLVQLWQIAQPQTQTRRAA